MATLENKIFQTIGIGSLPFNDTKRAVSYALKHDIAFLPQLPHLEGSMIHACKNKISLCLDEINRSKIVGPLKIQIPGPLSSNLPIKDILDYYSFLKESLSNNHLIVFIDEPYFPHLTKAHKELLLEIKKNDLTGIHSCGTFQISDINKLKVDFLSYDIYIKHSFALSDALNSCPNIVLGIVPTLNKFDKKIIDDIFLKEIQKTKTNILLSATCGLADRRIDTNSILNDLNDLKKRLTES